MNADTFKQNQIIANREIIKANSKRHLAQILNIGVESDVLYRYAQQPFPTEFLVFYS